jgi:acyl carrier protein
MKSTSKPRLSREEVHQVIWSLATEHVDREASSLEPGQRLMQDLGADSLDVAEMAMELEEKIGIKLPDTALDNADLTLGELENLVWKELDETP